MEDHRLLSGDRQTEDMEMLSLRPKRLNEYIGQTELKSELAIYIQAAKQRKEALDHVLLYGPPGLGKTTMAMVIANELEVGIKTTSGPAIERPGDLLAILNELSPGDVLFIDEIHRMPRLVEEVLYSAMEDFYVDIIIGQGTSAHPLHFELPPFTLIGATTRAGMLSQPLRDRFGIISHMRYYQTHELELIVDRNAHLFQAPITKEGALEIALRSRGTPRIANRILKRVRDFAQVAGTGAIDQPIADKALKLLNIDQSGLDHIDRKLLQTLIEDYHGGPVGIGTLAINISEDADTVEDMYEPYLIQKGFIKRTPRGRVATALAYQHLGYEMPQRKEDTSVND